MENVKQITMPLFYSEQEIILKISLTWLAVEFVYVIKHDIPAPFAA
jgi:hypothetical protein